MGGLEAPPFFSTTMRPECYGPYLVGSCALIALSLTLLSCSGPAVPLEDRVAGFWEALVARDRVRAQEFTTPDSRNDFLLRPERLYRSWEILSIDHRSDEEAQVRIAYEGFYEDVRQFKPLREWQLWRKIDGHWFLHVDSKEKILQAVQEKLYRGDRWSVEADGQVRVEKQVKIPFFNRAQLGSLTIRNGTEEPVRIVDVMLDETLFQVTENPGEIPAREKRPLKIAHLGPDELKNQKSTVTLEIEQEGGPREYQVEILFNYMSPGLRGILGLTEEQAAILKRTDKVSPNLKVELSPEQVAEARKMLERVDQSRQP